MTIWRTASVETHVYTLVSFVVCKESSVKTYLDPANLMLHKFNQEMLRHLAATHAHALHELRLGRLQAATTYILERAAQHLEPQRHLPQRPNVLGINRQLAVGA